MTLARTLVTGSGALAFRLEIEGWPHQFVTDARLTGTLSDGRVRVAGMQSDGIVVGEDIDITAATVNGRGCSITIADVGGVPTRSFCASPSVETVLTTDLAVGATSMTLASTAGLSNGSVVYVGTECILIGTVGTPCTSLTRAYRGSRDQAHYIADGARMGFPAVTDVPSTMRGRRARIYAYGSSDPVTVTDDGTQIFVGRVASDPVINGASWSIKIDPITSLFDQDLGQDTKEARPRGIYYSFANPLVIELNIGSDATRIGAMADSALVEHFGFHESQEDFAVALEAEITAATSGWSTDFRVISNGSDGWTIVAHTAAASPKYPLAFIVGAPSDVQTGTSSYYCLDAAGAAVETVAAASDYYFPVSATLPRGVFGRPPAGALTAAQIAVVETWPDRRIYLDGDVVPDALTTGAVVTWPDFEAWPHTVESYDASTRSVVLSRIPSRELGRRVYGLAAPPEIKLVRNYGTGTLHTLVTAITAASAQYMNTGSVPDLRSTPGTASTEDIDLGTTAGTSLLAVVNQATGSGRDPLTSQRQWMMSGSKRLSEVLCPEAQLLGCVWAIDGSGRLCLRNIPDPTAGTYAPTTIGAAQIDVSRGFGAWQRAAFGTLNTVVFKHDYDQDSDKWRQSIVVRDPAAFGVDHTKRAVTVEPVSTSPIDGGWRTSDAINAYTRIALRLLGIFGGPYATIDLPVNLSAFPVLCGDVVELTHAQLPNPSTGARGITARPCLVIGRDWDMATGKGTLKLVTSLSRVAGYTPSARISSSSGSGTAWTLTVAMTSPDGATYSAGDARDWFVTGDLVHIWEWDSASPGERWGTVGAVTATTVAVTLTASWTGNGSSPWVLDYGIATDALSADQKLLGFMSGADRRVDFSTSQAAFVMAR